jgi:hypothetical protein
VRRDHATVSHLILVCGLAVPCVAYFRSSAGTDWPGSLLPVTDAVFGDLFSGLLGPGWTLSGRHRYRSSVLFSAHNQGLAVVAGDYLHSADNKRSCAACFDIVGSLLRVFYFTRLFLGLRASRKGQSWKSAMRLCHVN